MRTRGESEYDVVVVGASVAGCTAATLYGRAGLRVALLEKHRSPDTFKTLCGHFVLGGTAEMLRRNDFWEPMVEAGAAVGGISVWAGNDWTAPPEDAPTSISLRRQVLDPLMRGIAAGTPGVELRLGEPAVGLVERSGSVVGVRTRDRSGAEHEYRGRLIIGADGHRSTVASLAKVDEDRAPNNRFGMWAYVRGVPAGGSRIWRLDPDTAICVRTDDGLAMLVAFPTKARLPDFRDDAEGALRRFFKELPDAPQELVDAELASKVIGMTDYPCVRRSPTPRPGLVLLGDAAITGDPMPAVGCGWAFRSAEWLVDATAPALRSEGPMESALAAYRRSLRFIVRHDNAGREEALARPANAVKRLVMRGVEADPVLARRAYLFAMRAIPVSDFLGPNTLVRAATAFLRRPRDREVARA